VTRIVAGSAKGRRLAVPSRVTRPTSERAREALFSSLAGLVDLEGARVLDLFAGSGAVGLEALSRGAAEVVLVEADRSACEVLRRNIDSVRLPGARLCRRPAGAYLVGGGADDGFDLVFADPPYAFPDDQLAGLLAVLVEERWVAEDGIVVVERSARGAPPSWPDGLEPVKQRRYGEGMLWYGRRR
jgi:16S rRNA (guanine966-N2)-methyltransferase